MEITKQNAREYLTEYVRSITTKSKSENMYICPLCGSGTGKHKTGAFSIKDSVTWKCFACDKGGDIFDLIGEREHLEGYAAQKAWFEKWKGLSIGADGTLATTDKAADTDGTDFSSYYAQVAQHIGETTYHRGISIKTLQRFNVGYDSAWRHPKVPNAPATPRLIIPTSNTSYLARDTRDQIPEEQRAYAKQKAGTTHIFNVSALQTATSPIFIVEGELDALSIIDVGGEAVALGSTSMADRLLQVLDDAKPAKPLVIALDNDKAGKDAARKIEEGLRKREIPFYRANPAEGHKDANEALQADRQAFTVHVLKIAMGKGNVKQYSADSYLKTFFIADMDEWRNRCVPTGFKTLDHYLGGGLHDGLYVIGGGTSVGKTTFLWQTADQIAVAGRHVLYWSLEMSARELVLKSISRHGQTSMESFNDKTDWCDMQPTMVQWADSVGDRLQILEGSMDTSITTIGDFTEKYASEHDRPVVCVDYLQIIRPRERLNDIRQEVEETVKALKIMSRDIGIPVIAVSSINRSNYMLTSDLTANKETGNIEYSSDCVMGLQLSCVDDFEIKDSKVNNNRQKYNNAKAENPRSIKLSGLKNRGGIGSFEIMMEYNPLTNTFWENANSAYKEPPKAMIKSSFNGNRAGKRNNNVLGWDSVIGDDGKNALVKELDPETGRFVPVNE